LKTFELLGAVNAFTNDINLECMSERNDGKHEAAFSK